MSISRDDAATGQQGGIVAKTRWESQQLQAKREGFKNAWEMRKAKNLKRNIWELDGRNRCYVEHASAEPATPLLDRLNAGSGPVRTVPIEEWREREPAQPGPDLRHLAAVWK